MNQTGKGLPQRPGVNRSHGQVPANTYKQDVEQLHSSRSHRPVATLVYRPEPKRIVQPRIAMAAQMPRQSKAPAVYSPQPLPKVLQTKTSLPKSANAGQAMRQPVPRAIQTKKPVNQQAAQRPQEYKPVVSRLHRPEARKPPPASFENTPGRQQSLRHELPHVAQPRAPHGKASKGITSPLPAPKAHNVRAEVRATQVRQAVAVVQRAEKPSNIGTSLTTEHGSQYAVGEGVGLTRHRYYGGTSQSTEKTVLYGDEHTTEECLEKRKVCSYYKVYPKHFGTWTITFYGHHREVLYEGTLKQWPEIGLYPVDMILNPTGKNTKDDRFHVGDKVTSSS